MSRTPQSALQRYKARRGETTVEAAPARRRFQWRWVRLATLAVVLAVVYRQLQPPVLEPIQLTYELDLSRAEQGALVITIVAEAEGELPRRLDMAFPPGVFGAGGGGISVGTPLANALTPDGRSLRRLDVEPGADGWSVHTGGAERAGLFYQVDLNGVDGREEDIRRHISKPVAGGVRAAGFEIFLEPLDVPVEGITVMMHNPSEMPVLVPWPALVRSADAGGRPERLADASLGFGQGFRPAADAPEPKPRAGQGGSAPVPANLLYHPKNLADLNNALLVCGDIRTLASRADDVVIQLATDRRWLFDDGAALDLVRRIARTQMGFFGSAPTDQITVLLSANDVTAAERFDVYGVHTGSSVLVLMDHDTTWGMVEEQAASVISHEMFHGWLGEAIPQQDDAMLWFTEGATTWYAARMLTAAGVWDPEHARGVLGARLERDYAGNELLGRLPVADAASEVMAPAGQVRFAYAGGVAACMALDEMITSITGRQRPLDEVLRRLYHNRDGSPLTRERLESTISSVTGVDCGPWLDVYVYGKTALPPIKRMI
jgi:hypothetical protein